MRQKDKRRNCILYIEFRGGDGGELRGGHCRSYVGGVGGGGGRTGSGGDGGGGGGGGEESESEEKKSEERERERERERFILCFWVNSLKILIYFIFLCFDPIIKRKGP